ncbi:hypothetical protein EG344_19110 [Chryseobacterium sp. G0162]|uniref:hypothetical protein n=1 Tax=Chryseobacterium sp. G0162 TaxID=2487063 RepID=UPI000F504E08|nr:hypothetical protein [Chryseobacterium sp. G0162]AZB10796.1 hypothetical protein EG344_19110 [Chryseobacterium sp. G0162]
MYQANHDYASMNNRSMTEILFYGVSKKMQSPYPLIAHLISSDHFLFTAQQQHSNSSFLSHKFQLNYKY